LRKLGKWRVRNGISKSLISPNLLTEINPIPRIIVREIDWYEHLLLLLLSSSSSYSPYGTKKKTNPISYQNTQQMLPNPYLPGHLSVIPTTGMARTAAIAGYICCRARYMH